MLDDCFHPAIFEVVSELGSEEYGKRVFPVIASFRYYVMLQVTKFEILC